MSTHVYLLDYFNVNTEWVVTACSNQGQSPQCFVVVHLEVVFHKYTWLQGTIESNTKAELVDVYDRWIEFAHLHIRSKNIARSEQVQLLQQQQQQHQQQQKQQILPSTNSSDIVAGEVGASLSKGDGTAAAAASQGHQIFETTSDSIIDLEIGEEDYLLGAQNYSRPTTPILGVASMDEDDEDGLLFYDCDDGGSRANLLQHQDRMISGRSFPAPEELDRLDNYYGGLDSSRNRTSTRMVGLIGAYDLAGDLDANSDSTENAVGSNGGTSSSSSSWGSSRNTRDMAVSTVETMFVFAEFGFWQIHNIYMYDLKELLNIEPRDVLLRVFHTLIPGRHAAVLSTPDMYGPMIAVLALPQGLMLSMEIGKNGCNPTSQLGNAVVMCLFIWGGLSVLYRLVAMLLSPQIGFKHCFCMIGYSFFAWNLALLIAYPLEMYKDSLNLPFSAILIPLVILGIPSSLAQGYMFWDLTPNSSMTLQPNSLPVAVQHFATQHSRLLQRVLWVLPKLLAFILVAGTHYQFLWYMARVFLPGSRQLCRLSALMSPSHYTDILSQKVDISLF